MHRDVYDFHSLDVTKYLLVNVHRCNINNVCKLKVAKVIQVSKVSINQDVIIRRANRYN